ncbi:rhodanese-like domain-containing protein [Fundidesulfovibrio terrae]|uniref:rhodanese-like domain-containing protein n=1 Tax=Fundidesulfovibrio terrae TaxID=2922866 RepID=UPI001FAF7839|nr:rhodanese-like domain-containing protein [Fundidesulfovibrio terrae]
MKRTAPLFLAAIIAAGGIFAPPPVSPLSMAQAKEPVLPRAATPAETAQLLAKPPAGFEIVDIRPQAEFADYALPGSLNLDAAAVLADESFFTGAGPLLIVDKDGTRAFALAGALAQKTSRPLLVLRGGLAAWWAEREMGAVVKETPLTGAPSPAPAPGKAPASPGAPSAPGSSGSPAPGTPAAPATPGAPAPAPQPPASKSAGC